MPIAVCVALAAALPSLPALETLDSGDAVSAALAAVGVTEGGLEQFLTQLLDELTVGLMVDIEVLGWPLQLHRNISTKMSELEAAAGDDKLAHDLYVWNGRQSLALTKAVALTKCFELERALINDTSGAIRHLHAGHGGGTASIDAAFRADYAPPPPQAGEATQANHLLALLSEHTDADAIECSSLLTAVITVALEPLVPSCADPPGEDGMPGPEKCTFGNTLGDGWNEESIPAGSGAINLLRRTVMVTGTNEMSA